MHRTIRAQAIHSGEYAPIYAEGVELVFMESDQPDAMTAALLFPTGEVREQTIIKLASPRWRETVQRRMSRWHHDDITPMTLVNRIRTVLA